MKDAPAFMLLTQIALRARWSRAPGLDGLVFGESLVGDYGMIGLSEKAYRCAKGRLAKWGLASFAGSSKGTVARLLDNRVYALDARNDENSGDHEGGPFSEENLHDRAGVAADVGRTWGGRGATNKKERRKEGEESNTSRRPVKPEPAHARNPLFDALAEAAGIKPCELVGPPARACGVALASIRKATPDVTPEEIHRRAQNYASHFDAVLTPFALANQWAKCHAAKERGGRKLSTEFQKF
ncbi:MAG: hypothetical protein HYV75_10835 [Opitutae bacterium]|nr:hypothetical protein [Opitutae bacterium]